MKKILFIITMMIFSAVVANAQQTQQFRVKNPARFETITFNKDGFGTSTGTGYILKVPISALPCASVPQILIYPSIVDKNGNFLLIEESKAGKLDHPSYWPVVYDGAPDGINYTEPRPVTVQIQVQQLIINGQLMLKPDGTPAIEYEKIKVFL